MEKQNVVLIGMPGVGKSTVGVILAKVLGYEFVDSDLLIQKAEKRLLREIIADEGQDGFLKIENRVNSIKDMTDTPESWGIPFSFPKENPAPAATRAVWNSMLLREPFWKNMPAEPAGRQ